MAGGRPTKYDPSMCNEIEEQLSQGLSLTAASIELGIHRDTAYEWAKEYPEFSDAIKMGRAKGQREWEFRLRDQALCGSGNSTAMIFAMKNLYQDDWRDKTESEITGKDGAALVPVINVSIPRTES